MRKAVLGAVLGIGVLVAAGMAFDWPPPVMAQRPAAPPVRETAGDGGLIAVPGTTADNGQLITLVDPRSRSMAVYRIEAGSGKIKLLAVRALSWDLQIMQLNSENPSPQEIRSLLEQQR